MRRFLISYATRHGQTEKVAEFVNRVLCESAHVEVVRENAATVSSSLDLTGFDAVILAASVHVGSHARELSAFVRRHREALRRVPTLFLSVSLAQAAAENTFLSSEKRAQAGREVESAFERFRKTTGFRPTQTKPVAGALRYSKYGPIVRFVMKRIATSSGLSPDTSHDHEYTHWNGIRKFVELFASRIPDRFPEVSQSARAG